MENCSDGGGCGRPEGVLLPIGIEEIVNTRLKWSLAPLSPPNLLGRTRISILPVQGTGLPSNYQLMTVPRLPTFPSDYTALMLGRTFRRLLCTIFCRSICHFQIPKAVI
jgi:hypothetical protein